MHVVYYMYVMFVTYVMYATYVMHVMYIMYVIHVIYAMYAIATAGIGSVLLATKYEQLCGFSFYTVESEIFNDFPCTNVVRLHFLVS